MHSKTVNISPIEKNMSRDKKKKIHAKYFTSTKKTLYSYRKQSQRIL